MCSAPGKARKFFHSWSKWRLFGSTDSGWPVQRRECTRCGKAQLELV